MLLVGRAIYLAGTIDDIATVPRHVRAFNRRHEISLVPTLGEHGGGITLGGRF